MKTVAIVILASALVGTMVSCALQRNKRIAAELDAESFAKQLRGCETKLDARTR